MRQPCAECGKHVEECDCGARNDFALRCIALDMKLRSLMRKERSPRVWVVVMGDLTKEIIKQQNDPEECLNDVIKILNER